MIGWRSHCIRLLGIFRPDCLSALQEKRAAELAFWVQQDTFSESGLSAKHAELRAFPEIFRRKQQSFSAVETGWRRELDSNSRYRFASSPKVPFLSSLPGFHPRNERGGETN